MKPVVETPVVENWNTVKDPVKERKEAEEEKKRAEKLQKEKEIVIHLEFPNYL